MGKNRTKCPNFHHSEWKKGLHLLSVTASVAPWVCSTHLFHSFHCFCHSDKHLKHYVDFWVAQIIGSSSRSCKAWHFNKYLPVESIYREGKTIKAQSVFMSMEQSYLTKHVLWKQQPTVSLFGNGTCWQITNLHNGPKCKRLSILVDWHIPHCINLISFYLPGALASFS